MLRLNVETIGDALIVQHYVAEVKEPALCRMVSISDAINKNGRTKVKVEWRSARGKSTIRRPSTPITSVPPC
jgi:hypothetical protein